MTALFQFQDESGLPSQGQIIKKVGDALIIEGMAQDSGFHFLQVSGQARRFDSLKEVEDYAEELAQDSEDPPQEGVGSHRQSDTVGRAFNRGRQSMMQGQTKDNCPYEDGSDHAQAWHRGYDHELKTAGLSKDAETEPATLNYKSAGTTRQRPVGVSVEEWQKRPVFSPQTERRLALRLSRPKSEGLSKDVSVSQKQHDAMGAAAGGKSKLGIPKSVGAEFMKKDKGKGFPK